MRGVSRIAGVLLLCTVAASVTFAEEESPLARFGALVIGNWETEDSRHAFEWGVGGRVIRSKSYFKKDGDWTLVSEGMWFWDGAEETVRGVAVATGMPVELFEYRSQVLGEEIVHDLVAQGVAGGRYVERWRFADGEYHWSLEEPQEGKAIMNGSYRRVAAAADR